MRYVPSLCLRSGMILGKNIYGDNGQLLLNKGIILNDTYIESINKLGFSGIYINDTLSEDIEIVNIVSDDLRQKTISSIKELFNSIDNDSNDKFKKVEELKHEVEAILEQILDNKNIMLNMVDLKFFDDYTYQHSVNVAILSIIIGVSLNLGRDTLYKLGLSGLLHDIGKVFIDKKILNKRGKLSTEEFNEIKKHVSYGYDYLKKEFKFPELTCLGAVDHHEKFDGTGYPSGKIGTEISLFGRIIAIADVYDALTSERPYRTAMLPNEAIEYLMGGTGSHFDSDLISVFVKKVAPYPLGTCVKLSNGFKGIVIQNFEDTCLRPKIRVFEIDSIEVEPFEINLRSDTQYLNITIKEIVKQ